MVVLLLGTRVAGLGGAGVLSADAGNLSAHIESMRQIMESADIIEKLPKQLQDLIARSMALQRKVRRLDSTIHAPVTERAAIGNPLVPQLNRLKAAFER